MPNEKTDERWYDVELKGAPELTGRLRVKARDEWHAIEVAEATSRHSATTGHGVMRVNLVTETPPGVGASVIARLLNYSFEPVGWRHDGLTAREKQLCSAEEFTQVIAFYRRVTGIDPTTYAPSTKQEPRVPSKPEQGPLEELVGMLVARVRAELIAGNLNQARELSDCVARLIGDARPSSPDAHRAGCPNPWCQGRFL